MDAAAFLAETGRERIGRFRERLHQATADPTSEEAIHDLRVSIRRVLAWTAVREELIGPDPGLRETRTALKKLMSPLGRLRDAHVKRDAIRKLVPSGDRPSYLYAVLVASDVLRWEARVRRVLGERRTTKLRIRAPEPGAARADEIDVLASAARYLAGLAAAVARHREAALSPENPEALHRMRLAFKKYRYSWELFSPLLPGDAKPTAKRYHAFQTLLGTIHDCDVILEEAAAFRDEFGGFRGPSAVETAFRKLREERFVEFRRRVGTPRGLSRLFGKTPRT